MRKGAFPGIGAGSAGIRARIGARFMDKNWAKWAKTLECNFSATRPCRPKLIDTAGKRVS
jgi:hypothetical protein